MWTRTVMMPTLLASLLYAVTFATGGYDPWGTLTLEVGSGLLLGWILLETLWSSRLDDDARRRAHEAWRHLPFLTRHRSLASFLDIVTLGRLPILSKRRDAGDVEIILPGGERQDGVEIDAKRYFYVGGLPMRRSGLGVPLLLLTAWIGLSAVPWRAVAVEIVSPAAYAIQAEAAALRGETLADALPWSLTPFLTWRGLWIWLAAVGVFVFAFRLARDPKRVERFAFLLLVLGVVLGGFGVIQWLSGVRALFGQQPMALRATGTFGNPNHYASFLAMLLMVGVGWLGSYRARSAWRARGSPRDAASNRQALAFIVVLGLLVLGLGLLLSLSRSGISFALGAGVFLTLIFRSDGEKNASVMHRAPSRARARDRSGARFFWALALATASFLVWLGIEPVLGRFSNLEAEWQREGGRTQVWMDSAKTVEDYWLTGSGLSSFRYLSANYRSFPGVTFYSWAHNDYLQVLIELGAPGLLLLSWLIAAVAHAAWAKRRALGAAVPLVRLHAGFCAAVVAVALHSLTDFSLHMPAVLALLAAVVGVVVGIEADVHEA